MSAKGDSARSFSSSNSSSSRSHSKKKAADEYSTSEEDRPAPTTTKKRLSSHSYSSDSSDSRSASPQRESGDNSNKNAIPLNNLSGSLPSKAELPVFTAATSNSGTSSPNNSNPDRKNSFKIDLSAIKRQQEAEAIAEKPHLPNTDSSDSSSEYTESATSSKLLTPSTNNATSNADNVPKSTIPPSRSLSSLSSFSSARNADNNNNDKQRKKDASPRSSSHSTTTRSSRTRSRSRSHSPRRSPSFSSSSPSSRRKHRSANKYSSKSGSTSSSISKRKVSRSRSSSSSSSPSPRHKRNDRRSRSRTRSRSPRSRSYSRSISSTSTASSAYARPPASHHHNHHRHHRRGGRLESESDYSDSVSTSDYSYNDSAASKSEGVVVRDKFPALRDWFSDLPEPPSMMSLRNVNDEYIKSLHANIASLHYHIRTSVQPKEEELMKQFVHDLSKFDGTMNRKEDERRVQFLKELEKIKATRKQFRGMLFDSVRERNKAVESKNVQGKQEKDLTDKINGLKPRRVVDMFTTLFFSLQVAIILFFIIFVDYAPAKDEGILRNNATYYRFYSAIAFMLFVGYAFLGSSLKKNVYSALSSVFMVGVLAVQWAMLWNYWWSLADKDDIPKLQVVIPDYINALYAAVTCAISFAVMIGRATPLQAVGMVFCECFFYALNVWINIHTLGAVDAGGSIVIHLFGALFGVGASISLFWKSKHPLDKTAVYTNEVMSLFGTLFLWVLFPSFNAAVVAVKQRPQAIVNTILALASSSTIAAAISHLRGPKYRFVVEDIRNASLAGGIAVAASANLVISPWTAILIGFFAGIIGVLSVWKLSPALERKMGLKESRSVIALHLVMGLVGGIVSILATGAATKYDTATRDWEIHFYENHLAEYLPEGDSQPGIQIAAIFITVGISLFSGFLTGIGMWWLRDSRIARGQAITDEQFFTCPEDM